jgi:hypothetical protein
VQLFAIEINSRNVVADRLRAVDCDYTAAAGYATYFGSWLDPRTACAILDRETGGTATERLDEESTQPGGKAPADLQPRGGAA